jgi:hypothetical protein
MIVTELGVFTVGQNGLTLIEIDQVTTTLLPTSRLFGRITQKGPNKIMSGGYICDRFFADFILKGSKKGPDSEMFVFLLIISP